MDYKDLISNALNANSWDEIIRLATLAKKEENDEHFLGICSGYINIIQGSYDLLPILKDAGFRVLKYNNQPELTKDIKAGIVNKEMLNTECVVLFAANGGGKVITHLIKENYPINYFTATTTQRKDKSSAYKDSRNVVQYKRNKYYNLTNKSTGEKTSIRLEEEFVKALIRESKIQKLLK